MSKEQGAGSREQGAGSKVRRSLLPAPCSLLIVLAFSVAAGRLAWCVYGPPPPRDYLLGGEVALLVNAGEQEAGSREQGARSKEPGATFSASAAKQLYLRRTLRLSQRPRHAWIQVLGRDVISLYVNGQHAATQEDVSFPVGIVTDLTPFLTAGTNVIAITTRQEGIAGPPRVAVEGAYWLDDGEHPLGPDDRAPSGWRCSSTFERRAGWWFLPEFDDRQWPHAGHEPGRLCAMTPVSPRASMVRGTGKWITAGSTEQGARSKSPAASAPGSRLPAPCPQRSMAVRREFNIAGRPSSGWLRITTNACYCLAINGVVVDQQDAALGTTLSSVVQRRICDITPLLRANRNIVSLRLTSTTGTPALLAEMEVEDAAGRRMDCGSDERWQGRAGFPADWYQTEPETSSVWQPCRVESGDLGIPPWQPRTVVCSLTEPAPVRMGHCFSQLGLITGIALATMLLCKGVATFLRLASGRKTGSLVVYLPLVPVAVAIGLGILATYDPRLPRQWVYQECWIFLALLVIAAQWAVMILAAWLGELGAGSKEQGKDCKLQIANCKLQNEKFQFSVFNSLLGVFLSLLLVAAGFYLRAERAAVNPIQTDEVLQYRATQGFWLRGVPSYSAGEGQPPSYISTSELVYYVVSLASYFCRDDIGVNRFPAVVFGTLAVLGLYVAGRRMFGRSVGLAAAALAAFSPYCIHMSSWGRYPSQLHFFSLLTLSCFWRTIEGSGPIDRRWLWATAASFIAMYLTWEASAFMAAGMVLAALVQRRGSLRTILGNRAVWTALLVVFLVLVLQYCHRTFQQVHRLWYGYGDTKVALTAMWRYPSFDILGNVRAASWNRDFLLPGVGILAALVIFCRHGWQPAARFLAVIFLSTCFSMSLLMPTNAFRYIFHMVPLAILLAAAALVAGARFVSKLADPLRGWQVAYGRGVAALTAIGVIAAACGYTLQLTGMTQQTGAIPKPADALFCPNFTGPMAYVAEHWREGDVVVSDLPVTAHHLFANPVAQKVPDTFANPFSEHDDAFYWSESVLHFQELLGNNEPRARHRFDGAANLLSLDDWQQFLAGHRRVWCVCSKLLTAINDRPVRSFIRQNMDVQYEDFETLVLLRDSEHRPAEIRSTDEQTLRRSKASFLP